MQPYVTADSLKEKMQTWLKQIAPFNTHEMHLDIGASALMVIDMQEFFLNPISPTFTCGGEAIIPNVQRLLAAFRTPGHFHPPRAPSLRNGCRHHGLVVGGNVP